MLNGFLYGSIAVFFAIAIPVIITKWNQKPWVLELRDLVPDHIPYAYFIIDGIEYSWSGWFGCQLQSIEKRCLPAGTTRIINIDPGIYSVEMRVFTTERKKLSYLTTWAVPSSGNINEHSSRIRLLKKHLVNLI